MRRSSLHKAITFLGFTVAVGLGACAPQSDGEGPSVEKPTLLRALPIDAGDPLPAIPVSGFSAARASIPDMLRLLLKGKPVSLAVDAESVPSQMSAQDVSGPLSQVVEELAETAGFFYVFHATGGQGGILRVSQDQRFVIPLPPVDGLGADVAAMAAAMGGRDVAYDKATHLLSFQSGRKAWRQITDYLDHIRRSRVMITWDVRLWTAPAGGSLAAIPMRRPMIPKDKAAVAAALEGHARDDGALVLSMISGGQAVIAEEETRRVLVRLAPDAFDTEKINAGLATRLKADWFDGQIYADIEMVNGRLLGNDQVAFPGHDAPINLPSVVAKRLRSSVRLSPGECLLTHGLRHATGASVEEAVLLLCPSVTPLESPDSVAALTSAQLLKGEK